MGKKTFFKGATIIKGNGEEAIKNGGLLIEDKNIVKVGKAEDVTITQDVEVIDLTGKSIMPGMINCHVHFLMEPVGNAMELIRRESLTKTAMRGATNLRKYLKSGVTYIRDVGGYEYIEIELKKCLEEGLIEGPGVLTSGKCLTMTGGHGWMIGRECNGADDCRKAAREQIKAGADVVKIMATGGVMTPGVEPGSPQLTFEEMKAAIEEAHKAGKKTATHAQGTTGIKNAILAGIDSIEHGIFLDDEAIEMMIERGVYLVPTLVAPYFIVEYGIEGGIPAYAVEKSKRVIDSHIRSFQKAREAGIKIAMGTDGSTPFNSHDKSGYELKLMVEAGMSPMEAIIASTKTAAELLGIEANYGTIEDGKVADFIVLKGNPLNNISAVLDVERVYKNGKLYI